MTSGTKALGRLTGAIAALVLLVLAAIPAGAAQSEYGTPAWALRDLVLRQGPGTAYPAAGTIPGLSAITVERCAPRWCLVSLGSAKGWTGRDHIGFGQEPRPPLSGPRLNYGAGGPGQVCFFTGANYTGRATCHGAGFVAHDLKLYGLDDSYVSVSVQGNVSASVCRDRNFQSYCRRIVESTPVLETYLARNVSSIRIH